MSETQTTLTDPVRKDFRSSYYYKSLHGVKGGEKTFSHLETLLRMEVLDTEKLEIFCLQHTLPVYCRPLCWKVLLGVLPVYTDKETTGFIEGQKSQQYSDLRHTLEVMGKIATVSPAHKLEEVKETPSSDHPVEKTSADKGIAAHGPQKRDPTPSEEFVLVYLLENNKLLSAAENQLGKGAQMRLQAIAEAFLLIFDEEKLVDRYWLFSGFIKMCDIRLLPHLDTMVSQCMECLASEDSVLFGHLRSIGAIEHTLPLHRWFCECFARDLPESCLECVWDRVVAGSCLVLVFVAVAILLSIKRKILGLSSATDLPRILHMIPRENFTAIVSKGLQLWESQGSPLLPR